MAHPLHILYVVEDPNDVELIKNSLHEKRISSFIEIADDDKSLVKALENKYFDIVLAGFDLLSLHSNHALEVVKQRMPDVPFILLWGRRK